MERSSMKVDTMTIMIIEDADHKVTGKDGQNVEVTETGRGVAVMGLPSPPFSDTEDEESEDEDEKRERELLAEMTPQGRSDYFKARYEEIKCELPDDWYELLLTQAKGALELEQIELRKLKAFLNDLKDVKIECPRCGYCATGNEWAIKNGLDKRDAGHGPIPVSVEKWHFISEQI